MSYRDAAVLCLLLPCKKAATFFHLDERINMMISLEFASQLPLLHGADGKAQTAAPVQLGAPAEYLFKRKRA
jgi:hypothetical protein